MRYQLHITYYEKAINYYFTFLINRVLLIMKKLLIVFLLCFTCIKAELAVAQQVPVIKISGKPFDRGYQHGQQLKPQIAEVYQKWKESLEKDSGKKADEIIADFLTSTRYKTYIEKWTPEIYEEIKGIAAGSDQSLDDVFAFQIIDEYWGYLDRLKNNTNDQNKCTAVAVAKTKEQPTLVAQNVDIDNYMHGYQVLIHIQGGKNTPEQFIMTCAGYLGFAGMNKNISLVINALTDVSSSVYGLPVPFVTRGILQQWNAADAVEFINTVQHATGQSYLVGSPRKVYAFEASANQVVEFNPHNRKLVYHTNHSLVNEDIKPWRVEIRKQMLSGQGRKSNSATRLQGVHNFLAKFENRLTKDNIKDILRSKEDPIFPICVPFREGGSAFTFSSVVFTLGDRPSAEVTYGTPDQNEYQQHFFN